ncbi:MAG: hypothetical protein A2705_00475 [Omnitrophica WOR_2 bacterium RIFCSPHIGHO2_01_FULL_52_10]|nr:MAG: hypothetical protein A2705_00475 [Omnitrophica WOR_2 bacterium RIFCSPHIGHO2_01_FULL_52_10]
MPKALAKAGGYKTLVRKISQEFAELGVFVKNRFAKAYCPPDLRLGETSPKSPHQLFKIISVPA